MKAEQMPAALRPLVITAWQDILGGLRRADIFLRLGWLEIKRRYRRTIIGPWWGTFNLGVLILALGGVGGGIMNRHFGSYLPYLATGMILWVFISAMITEASSLFMASQNLYQQLQFNYSILAYVLVWRNFIVFLHNIIPYFVLVILLAPHLITPWTLLAIPGAVIVMVNGAWVALFLGLICLRFRDIQQLVTTFVQIGLFITPILWTPDKLTGMRHLLFVDANPLYSMLEVVRAPLLGTVPSLKVYVTALAITIVGWVATFVFFRHFRKRISYWA